jgi:hypothetical protein
MTTSPIAVAEPVKISTSHARAIVKAPSPSEEQVCPSQSSAKERLWSECSIAKRLIIFCKMVLSLKKTLLEKKRTGISERRKMGTLPGKEPSTWDA